MHSQVINKFTNFYNKSSYPNQLNKLFKYYSRTNPVPALVEGGQGVPGAALLEAPHNAKITFFFRLTHIGKFMH